jgi:anti-sigma regulatory factor (Ser/Thr protein kinase)
MTFHGGLNSVRDARRFLAVVLEDWGADRFDFGAPQVVSELATNAALHARTTFTVDVHLEDECLLIEVSDASPRVPRARHYAVDATTGRGIGLVAALSSDWGTTVNGAGKTVWAPDDTTLRDLDLSGLAELDLLNGADAGSAGRGQSPSTSDKGPVGARLAAKVA